MRNRHVLSAASHLFALAFLSAGCASSGFPPQAGSADWQPPLTSFGHPDLQGSWTNSTLTPFQRAQGVGPVFTPDQVRQIESPDDDGCPPNPGTVACGRAALTGSNEARLTGQEYNEVYWDRGSRVAVVNGEPRSSLVTRPADGRVPDVTPAARQVIEARGQARSGFEQYDHPELRPLAERCVVSFGMSAGPPMVPNSAYNNNYTIVQSPDHILILAEMIHDARVIRLGDPVRLPSHVRPWFGDSWGRWDGNTLVVETTNLNPDHPFRGVPPSAEARVIERFTRVDEDTILYDFTIEDPVMYTEPWGGEIPFERLDGHLYEYACHEGNYSLIGVLSGARYEERMEAGEPANPR